MAWLTRLWSNSKRRRQAENIERAQLHLELAASQDVHVNKTVEDINTIVHRNHFAEKIERAWRTQ